MRRFEKKHRKAERSSLIPVPLPIHWAAILSVVLGLLDLLLVGCLLLFFSANAVELEPWWWVLPSTRWYQWQPIFGEVCIGGGIYALVGWILGLIAFQVARTSPWRRGRALAAWGLGFHLASFVGMGGYIILLLSTLSHMH